MSVLHCICVFLSPCRIHLDGNNILPSVKPDSTFGGVIWLSRLWLPTHHERHYHRNDEGTSPSGCCGCLLWANNSTEIRQEPETGTEQTAASYTLDLHVKWSDHFWERMHECSCDQQRIFSGTIISDVPDLHFFGFDWVRCSAGIAIHSDLSAVGQGVFFLNICTVFTYRHSSIINIYKWH